MKFTVEKEIFEKMPTVCFGVVVAKGIDNVKIYPEINNMLEENIEKVEEYFSGKKVKEDEHIVPYREAFRSIGINPNKFMCSIEALFTRIAKGKGMPKINSIVDIGNAVSLKYMLPMGAHDLDIDASDINVRMSVEGDEFIPFGETEPETLDVGEVVYATGNKVRTRRWTWRQSEYGKIKESSSYIFFPIDGFTDVNKDKVIEAREELSNLLKEIFGCEVIVGYVDIEQPEMIWK